MIRLLSGSTKLEPKKPLNIRESPKRDTSFNHNNNEIELRSIQNALNASLSASTILPIPRTPSVHNLNDLNNIHADHRPLDHPLRRRANKFSKGLVNAFVVVSYPKGINHGYYANTTLAEQAAKTLSLNPIYKSIQVYAVDWYAMSDPLALRCIIISRVQCINCGYVGKLDCFCEKAKLPIKEPPEYIIIEKPERSDSIKDPLRD